MNLGKLHCAAKEYGKFRPLLLSTIYSPLTLFSSRKTLTPRYLEPFLNERDYDPLKLLSILVKDCDLQPSSIFFHTDLISKSILLSMSSKQLDSDCSVSSNDCNWTSIFKYILGKVVVLRLQCKGYGNIWVMVRMIRTATSGTNSQLIYMFCTMSNLYMDVIQPFSTLLSLQNFCQLTLEIDKLCPLTFKKLLQEFMKAPHTKKTKDPC